MGLTWMMIYQNGSRDGNIQGLLEFLLLDDPGLWKGVEAVCYVLDTTGVTWDLILGTSVELLNMAYYAAWYVFDYKMPNENKF